MQPWLSESLISENLISGMIGVLGAIIGGAFTLFATWWTLKKQKELRELDSFSEQVSNLLEINILSSTLFLKFSELSLLDVNDNQIGEVEREINTLVTKMYVCSSKVDHKTFEKIHEIPSIIYDALYNINALKLQGEAGYLYEFTERIKNRLMETAEFSNKHREALADTYNEQSKKTKRRFIFLK